MRLSRVSLPLPLLSSLVALRLLLIPVLVPLRSADAASGCTPAQQTSAAGETKCAAFHPECGDGCAPYAAHDWSVAGYNLFGGDDGDRSTGATRVVASPSETSFAGWAGHSRNAKWNNSACLSGGMAECCLLMRSSDIADWACPTPSNPDVMTVMVGERRTLRLPPSPCDATDTDLIPVSGYNLITGETVLAHQVSICRTERTDPSTGTSVEERYGCVHIDGISPGPASWLSIAYYGSTDTMKQGRCSAAKALKGSTAKGFTEAFGAWLDAKFGGGDGRATKLLYCPFNTTFVHTASWHHTVIFIHWLAYKVSTTLSLKV